MQWDLLLPYSDLTIEMHHASQMTMFGIKHNDATIMGVGLLDEAVRVTAGMENLFASGI